MSPRCIYSVTNILGQNVEQFFNIRIDSDHFFIDIAIKSVVKLPVNLKILLIGLDDIAIALQNLKGLIRIPVSSGSQSRQDCSAKAGILLDLVDDHGSLGDICFQLGPKAILTSPTDTYHPGKGIAGEFTERVQHQSKLQR